VTSLDRDRIDNLDGITIQPGGSGVSHDLESAPPAGD
jgi:hypothetical protein